MSSFKNESRKNIKIGIVKWTILNVVFYANGHKLIQKNVKIKHCDSLLLPRKLIALSIIVNISKKLV